MTDFNYEIPGEFYSRKRQGTKQTGLTYQRFKTAAEAIRFAMEALPSAALNSSMLEAGGDRYKGKELRALYADPKYPLRRANWRSQKDE
ncbi:MAG TPA: hypothetical protein VFM05_14235, partial [Candidatus Saccharimonadales bacterium]|nr:hypothetical protein [Candidatus Saccharimonadales bacterium]